MKFMLGDPGNDDLFGLILCLQRNCPAKTGVIINQSEPVAMAQDTRICNRPKKVCMNAGQKTTLATLSGRVRWLLGFGLNAGLAGG